MIRHQDRRRRATLTDVAKEAGVSLSCASSALTGRGRVGEKTRKAVLHATQRLGYRHNAFASRLRTRQSHVLAVLATNLPKNPGSAEIVEAFEIAAHAAGKTVILSSVTREPQELRARVNALLEMQVEGVMFFGSVMFSDKVNRDFIHNLQNAGVALALYTSAANIPEITGIDSVTMDYAPGAEEALSYLYALGHRQVALIVGFDEPLDQGRGLGATYLSYLRKRDMSCTQVEIGQWFIEEGEQAMQRILAGRKRPTAVIAANDMMAVGAIHTCQKRGLQVPEDISIIGMDDILYATFSYPPLTTLAMPKQEIGQELLRMLVRERSEHRISVSIAQKLIIRESTGPVKKG